MPKWNNIGAISKYKNENQWLVEIEGRPVALFKYNDNYYAIKNSCAHQGYPLAEGNLKGCMVECPLHNKKIPTYKIREKNNCLEIFL